MPFNNSTFIVKLEVVLLFKVLHSLGILELVEHLLVVVLADVGETSGHNDQTILLSREHNRLKQFIDHRSFVNVKLIDDSRADNNVEGVPKLLRQVDMIVDVKVLQLCVDFLIGCHLEHRLGEVDPGYLLETSGGQLLPNTSK